jgi:integrase
MASIYRNGTYYWIKLRHPVDRSERRVSLQTGSRPRAELLKRKWEALCEFYQPEVQAAVLPDSLRTLLPPSWLATDSDPTVSQAGSPVVVSGSAKPLCLLVAEYLTWCRSANDAKQVANKAAILCAAFGKGILEGRPPDGPLAVDSLDRLTSAQVLTFIEGRPGRSGKSIARATKRHYRECFVQIWNHGLRDGSITPTNVAFPNPMTTLPSWHDNGHEIVFLKPLQIDEQLAGLRPHPTVHAAVATMIYAGPRRNEALWLKKESMREQNGERFFSVQKVSDKAIKQPLKTAASARSVTILPPLAAILDAYVPTVESAWLFPSPTGMRWDKDHFSQKLAEINEALGLPWSAMHYRHTYATLRAAEGSSVFGLAHEMGTSVAMIMRHYAAFFPPSARR